MNKKILITLLIILHACSNKEQKFNANYYYEKALKNIKSGNLSTSLENLEAIEIEHPYSEYAVKSEVLKIFIHYLQKNYAEAIIESDKFIKLRPANKYVQYIYFMKADSQYALRSDFLKEQTNSQLAKELYEQVLLRYPTSSYRAYAIEKISKINAQLANYNLDIGRKHLFNRQYVPALLRFQAIVNNYSETIYSDEANYRIVETLYSLGLKKDSYIYANNIKYKNKNWLNENIIFTKKYLTDANKITN
jgi:outer membrane protein assembly factor BamD